MKSPWLQNHDEGFNFTDENGDVHKNYKPHPVVEEFVRGMMNAGAERVEIKVVGCFRKECSATNIHDCLMELLIFLSNFNHHIHFPWTKNDL